MEHNAVKHLQQYANKTIKDKKVKEFFSASVIMDNAIVRFSSDKGFLDKQDGIRFIILQALRKEGYMQ